MGMAIRIPTIKELLMKYVVGWLAFMGSALPVLAHDLWLVPPKAAKPSETVTIEAISGMDFPKGDRAPDPAKFERMRVIHPGGQVAKPEPNGTKDKAGLITFATKDAGLYILSVETTPRLITLDAEAFNAYLVSDGLPHIYKLRVEEKTLNQPGKERYSKSPKVLVQVGKGDGDPSRVLGLPLEIVPLVNPFACKVGDTIPVRVLFQDKPLPEAHLGWDHPGDGEEPTGTVRTNAKGEARLPISQTGLMTIRLTYMTRPKKADYEWESFWTTLTFTIPE